jgi:hypothetical protein
MAARALGKVGVSLMSFHRDCQVGLSVAAYSMMAEPHTKVGHKILVD